MTGLFANIRHNQGSTIYQAQRRKSGPPSRKAERELRFADLIAEGIHPEDAAVRMGLCRSYGRLMLTSIRRQLGWQAR